MLRRASLVVVVIAVMLSACGRQVTGLNKPGGGSIASGITSGNMFVRFRTQGPLDFNTFQYVIVFNTSGTGTSPYATAFQTGFQNYSFAWVVTANGGVVPNPPILVQYFPQPGTASGVGTRRIVVPPNLAQLTLNTNNQNSEFTLQFSRSLFSIPNPTSPSPGTTVAPTDTPTASPTASASATASVTVSPVVSPTTAQQAIWYVNYITVDQNGIPQDALGLNGKNDQTYQLGLDTSMSFDYVQQLQKSVGQSTASNPSAAIAGGEIINAP